MKLTLRKANAVQASIIAAIKALALNYSVTLNEFEDVKDQIQVTRDRFQSDYTTRNKLLSALYEIRTKVAAANAASGINDMLAEVAYLEKQINHNNMLASKGTQTSLRVLHGNLKKAAEVKDIGYGYRPNDITTSIFTEEEIEDFRKDAANYKREKQSIQDQLLELNIQTTITLDEGTTEFLNLADIL